MLRVQIAVAKKSSSMSRPSSVDIYKRKVDSLKQHYEDQLKEMSEELAALKQEESNFYLDIATETFGKGATVAAIESKPSILVTERQCSINMSDISNYGRSSTVVSQPSKGTGLSGLFQQADQLFSDDPAAIDQSTRAATSINEPPAVCCTEGTSSVFKFKKTTPTLLDAAAKANGIQNKGSKFVGDHHKQQIYERTSPHAVGVGTAGAKVGSGNTSGSKGGSPVLSLCQKPLRLETKENLRLRVRGFSQWFSWGLRRRMVGKLSSWTLLEGKGLCLRETLDIWINSVEQEKT